MPVPLRVRFHPIGVVMVNALAPELNTILSTVVLADRDTLVILETPNDAMAPDPLGTVAGVQFAAVFQSPLLGLAFHIGSPAGAASTGAGVGSSLSLCFLR